jgi:hypothetical protein
VRVNFGVKKNYLNLLVGNNKFTIAAPNEIYFSEKNREKD